MAEYIKIKKWPADHAKDAHEAGYHIEALQTLHGWLEIKLRELFLLQRVGAVARSGKSTDWARAWNMTEELTLNNVAKALLIIGAIPQTTYDRINAFNRVRNNLIHRLFHDPYEKEYYGVRKDEYDQAFKEGMELGSLIENMSDEKIDN